MSWRWATPGLLFVSAVSSNSMRAWFQSQHKALRHSAAMARRQRQRAIDSRDKLSVRCIYVCLRSQQLLSEIFDTEGFLLSSSCNEPSSNKCCWVFNLTFLFYKLKKQRAIESLGRPKKRQLNQEYPQILDILRSPTVRLKPFSRNADLHRKFVKSKTAAINYSPGTWWQGKTTSFPWESNSSHGADRRFWIVSNINLCPSKY